MWIDELADAILTDKKITGPLKKRQQRILTQLNQPVFIRDLIVRSKGASHSYGEFKDIYHAHTNPYGQPKLDKLQAHISMLFNFANEDHRANFCQKKSDGIYHIQPGKENYITRLSMPEFSLYTDKPLSLEEFNAICNEIEQMAKDLEPNVHLLLSSFAVKGTPDLLNMSVFVEGGPTPKLHTFSKNTASHEDLSYHGSRTLFSQQHQDKKVSFHANTISDEHGLSISTGSVFEVSTLGGARYTQAIDVCFDHLSAHTQQLQARRIMTDAEPNEIFPDQIEQLVTSNTTDLEEKSFISNQVIHTDSLYSMHHEYQFPIQKAVLTPEAQAMLEPNEYDTQWHDCEVGYLVEKPPFGSDLIIETLQERSAGQYPIAFKKAIQAHNNQAFDKFSDTMLQNQSSDKTNLVNELNQNNILPEHLKTLETMLLKKCRPGFWQKLFKTEEYKQKLAAQKIIHESVKTFQSMIDTQGTASLINLRAWKNDLILQLNFIGSTNVHLPLQTELYKLIENLFVKPLEEKLNIKFEL